MRAVIERRTWLCVGSALWLLGACSNDVGPGQSADGGPSGPGRVGEAGTSSVAPPAAQSEGSGDGGHRDLTPQREPAKDACNELDIAFESRVATMYIVVDRSSSMFDRNFWEPLKASVLEVVQRLEREVRFGFATYTGEASGACPDLSKVAVAADNYGAIKAAYDAVARPNYKGETPTSLALDEVSALLQAESDAGPKFILLVTDGEPDFCDDSNVTCARDAVVGAAQAAFAKGITTYIFSIGGSVDQLHLANVANAGSGQPVVDLDMGVAQQCPNQRASYSGSSGTAPYFEPNIEDQQALVTALSSVVAGVRSCTFDLQGKVQIQLADAALGVVEIDGTSALYNDPNGFRMNSPTELELLGSSCERLRTASAPQVHIDFPCEALVVF